MRCTDWTVRCTDWYEARDLSRDESHARFPYKDEAPEPADDGGLAARLDELFARLGRFHVREG